MDFSGGYIPTPSPPISRSQSPAPSTLPAPSSAPSAPSPLATSSLPASSDADAPTQTLENELTNVMAGLGSFWGKVRKQSVTAYQSAEKQMETARKDLTPLVSKARANLDSLSETTKAEFARLSEAGTSGGGVVIGADGMPIIIDEPAPAKVDKGKGVDPSERGEGGDASTTAQDDDNAVNPGAAAAAFFAKLQSQVASNPNVKGLSKNLATLQTSVQSNLSHLPASLQTNLTQLQTQFAHIDLADTSKHAEEYLHKGEHWLADFSNEVQRLALDAVKVVPPSEAAMSDERSKKREERLRKAEQVAVGRRDLLIFSLRGDKEGLLVDPAQPPVAPAVGEKSQGAATDLREAFSRFLQSVEDRGGFEGKEWAKQVEEEIEAGGEKLALMVKALVPEKLTKEAFWSRYFFKVGQIDEDEQRRRKVLEVTEDNDDDFSWDMEDEDDEEIAPAPSTASTIPTSSSTSALAPPPASTTTTTSSSTTTLPAPDTPRAVQEPSLAAATPSSDDSSEPDWGLSPAIEQAPTMAPSTSTEATQISPRASSDGTSSYDVVGEASGTPSERGDVEVEEKKAAVEAKKEEESDEDSDWE